MAGTTNHPKVASDDGVGWMCLIGTCDLALDRQNPAPTVPLNRYAAGLAFDVPCEATLEPTQLGQTNPLIGLIHLEACGVGFRKTNSCLGLFLKLRRVNLLASEEPLITVVQFVQTALQCMHRRIFKKVAVRVGIVAPHRELLHHLVLPELFLFAATVAGLLHSQGPIPDEPLAARILTHQLFLSPGGLKPIVREALLYLHGCSFVFHAV